MNYTHFCIITSSWLLWPCSHTSSLASLAHCCQLLPNQHNHLSPVPHRVLVPFIYRSPFFPTLLKSKTTVFSPALVTPAWSLPFDPDLDSALALRKTVSTDRSPRVTDLNSDPLALRLGTLFGAPIKQALKPWTGSLAKPSSDQGEWLLHCVRFLPPHSQCCFVLLFSDPQVY